MEKNTANLRGYKIQPCFSAGTYEQIKFEAKNEGRSLSNMVVRLVEQALDMRANSTKT